MVHLFQWQHIIFYLTYVTVKHLWPDWWKLATKLKLAQLQERRFSSTPVPTQAHSAFNERLDFLCPLFVHGWSITLGCSGAFQLWSAGCRYSLDRSAVNQTECRETDNPHDWQSELPISLTCTSVSLLQTSGRKNPQPTAFVLRGDPLTSAAQPPISPAHLSQRGKMMKISGYLNLALCTGLPLPSQLCCLLWYQLKAPAVFALYAYSPYK